MPLHPPNSVDLWVSIWPESGGKCSISAGWIRDGVTGCEGVVMGTLAGAHRDLPSEAEHRCWARRGGTLLVRVHYAKVLVKEQPQRVEAVQ